jgi:hypothetical protein
MKIAESILLEIVSGHLFPFRKSRHPTKQFNPRSVTHFCHQEKYELMTFNHNWGCKWQVFGVNEVVRMHQCLFISETENIRAKCENKFLNPHDQALPHQGLL